MKCQALFFFLKNYKIISPASIVIIALKGFNSLFEYTRFHSLSIYVKLLHEWQQYRPWSDLGLHNFLRPLCQNT